MESTSSPPRSARRRTRILLLALAAALEACSAPTIPEGTLVVALESMPQNLDPRFATDAASSRIGELVFRSLTRTNATQQRQPDLALDWKLVSPRTISFRLRDDARFHDGAPVTAADVRATYESILDPSTRSPKRAHLEFIERIDAPDDTTVVWHLKEPYAAYLDATGIGILPRSVVAADRGDLVGAGPFRIATIEPNHEIRIAAVPDHRGLREIRFRVVPDETVRALEMKKATVHFVQNGIEPENLAWLGREPRLCVGETPGTTFQYLGLNLRDPALADRRVRRALALAIDREALVRHLLNGTARPATGLLTPGHWAYEPDVLTYGHDPAAARRLLDEAGWTDPPGEAPRLRLSYKTTTLASRRRIGEAIQAMLAEVGIALEVRSFEWGTFYDDVRRGSFQLYGLAWVGVSDPDFFFTILSSSMTPPRGNNRGFFASDEIDRLTLLGRRTFDPAERQRIYAEVQKIVAEELPFIPLWWEDNVVVRDRRLCGFVPQPDGGWISLRTAWWNENPPPGAEDGPCGCGRA